MIGSRLNDKYLQTKAASSSYRNYSDFPHSRSTATGIVAKDIYEASHPASASPPSQSPERFGGGMSSSSSRRVISDFSAFKASPGMSFSTAGSPRMNDQANFSGGSPPPKFSNSGVFGSPRMNTGDANSSMNTPRGLQSAFVDDEEEEDLEKPSRALPIEVSEDGGVEIKGEDGQRLAFRQGVISMDQVKRLAMQSAYRSGLAS